MNSNQSKKIVQVLIGLCGLVAAHIQGATASETQVQESLSPEVEAMIVEGLTGLDNQPSHN